jgi:hypothetical protein
MTIRNCWKKAGILPDMLSSTPAQPTLPISSLIHQTDANHAANNSDMDPAAPAKMLVKTALDDLEATGALQRLNRMNMAELLNPAIKSHNLFETTDKDIFNSVMDAKQFEKNVGGKGDGNGNSDNGNDDNNNDPALVPSHCELLQAALMLRKHVATINDPFACKLKGMLGSFGHRTHAIEMQRMTDTRLTDYFVYE